MDDFQFIDDTVTSSIEGCLTDSLLDTSKWVLPPSNNSIYEGDEASITNAFAEFEKEQTVWDASREKLYPISLGQNEFTESEAIQFGLEGLIYAMEKSQDGTQPIISQDHLEVELLKKRITEE